MKSNFAYNYLNRINELQQVLLQPHVDLCTAEMQIDIKEYPDGLNKYYYRDQDEDPCCMISFSDKGIIFYEKEIQNQSENNKTIS